MPISNIMITSHVIKSHGHFPCHAFTWGPLPDTYSCPVPTLYHFMCRLSTNPSHMLRLRRHPQGETRPEIRAREGFRFWGELYCCGKMWEPIHSNPSQSGATVGIGPYVTKCNSARPISSSLIRSFPQSTLEESLWRQTLPQISMLTPCLGMVQFIIT